MSDFNTVIADFVADLKTVFPEYAQAFDAVCNTDVKAHCLAVYPERFFDILYSNADIFEPTNRTNVEFLPNIDFRTLWNTEGVSDKSKECIWKYLQLILMSVLGSVNDTSKFGESANIFEAINEKDLQEKLQETMASISDFFKQDTEQADESSGENEGESGPTLPDMDDLQEHLKGLLEGKLGALVNEFSEEFTKEMAGLFGEYENITNPQEIIMRLVKNPQKLMLVFKRLADKLTTRMKNGEITKEELMQELQALMQKMQKMGGSKGDFADLMKHMKDLPFMDMLKNTLGKNMRMDMNKVNQMTKQNANLERMRSKLEKRQQAAAPAPAPVPAPVSAEDAALTDAELIRLFQKKKQAKKKKV